LLLSGDFIDAPEALRIGMVNRVYDDQQLLGATHEFAAALGRLSPVALQMIKRTVYQSARMDLATSLDLISSHMAIIQSTDDFAEAQSALAQQREPHFRGH
jgi:enoyl-CoA hydratase/carnithine racemase